MERIKTAIVGLGAWGSVHALAYSVSPQAELVCICDINEERAKAAAEKYHCSYTTKSEEIANNSDIQVVSIVTPDFAHYKLVMEMLDANKHVIVEKPLSTDVAEAEAMTAKAKQKGVKFMTDFHLRWNQPFIVAKQTIEAGRIGKPVMAYSLQANRSSIAKMIPWSNNTGPQWFLLPHQVDLVRWMLGQEAKQVFATARKEVLKEMGYDTYDCLQAQVVFEDSVATFETSWIMPEGWPRMVDLRLEVAGTKGKLESRQDRQCLEVATSVYETPAVMGNLNAYGANFGFIKEPILHFVDCVVNDKQPLIDINDGLAVTKIIAAVVKSIETGKAVSV